jgi:glucose-1-phosphatase
VTRVGLVCFDWGGVILRICHSWAQGCAAAGLDVRGDSADDVHRQERHALAMRYQDGALTTDDFLTQLAASTNGLYSREEVLAIHNAWLLGEYKGIGAVVDRLHRVERVETALLSNTNALHWQRHSTGLNGSAADFPTAGQLKHKVASHLVGVSKPSREIYQAMCDLTGMSGQAILFFDDLADNIEAARAMGWRAEQIDPDGDTAAQITAYLHAHGVLRDAR